MIPETGEMVVLGAGGTASAVRHLNRVRYYMSQLHEMGTSEGSSRPQPTPVQPKPPVVDRGLDYPLPAEALSTGVDDVQTVVIPVGRTTSTPFSTDVPASGAFWWVAPPGYASASQDVWVSLEPAGPPVEGSKGSYGQSESFGIKYDTDGWTEIGTQYYLNSNQAGDTPIRMVRKVLTTTRNGE